MFELRPYRKNNPFTTRSVRWTNLKSSFSANPFGFFGSGAIEEFKADIKDEGDHYELEADLPGFDKKDIHVDTSGDVLTIRAERHSEHEDKISSALTPDKSNARLYEPYERSQRTYLPFLSLSSCSE